MQAGNRHSADGNNPDGGLLSFSDDDERQPYAFSGYERGRAGQALPAQYSEPESWEPLFRPCPGTMSEEGKISPPARSRRRMPRKR